MRSVRLDEQLDRRLCRAAEAEGASVSEFIRRAVCERADRTLSDTAAGDPLERLADVLGAVHGGGRARSKLGQLAEEVTADDEAVVLVRRGQAVAVLVSPAEYDSLTETRRRAAQEELQDRLAQVRKFAADAGLDVSVVDEAITAARATA
jgi:prevent-host-death family protein